MPIIGGPAAPPNAAHRVDILNGDDNIVLRLHFSDAALASNARMNLRCVLEHCRALEDGETLALRAAFEGSPCEVTGDYDADCAPLLQHAAPIC
jgi:hypothetical protein